MTEAHTHGSRAAGPGLRASDVAGGALAGVLALAFYMATLAPSVGWGDAARLQLEVSRRGSTYWFLDQVVRPATDGWPFEFLGVAIWDHPLYVMLGQCFVAGLGGDPAWRVNVMSALTAALAIAAFFQVSRRLTDDRLAAALGTVALAVSHTFWFHAVTTEVYALHSLFVIVLVGLTLMRHATGSRAAGRVRALVAGIGAANHVMLGLTAAVLIAWELGERSARAPRSATSRSRPPAAEIWVWVACFAVGFSPWWIQFVRMAHAIGVSVTLSTATGMPALAQRVLPDSPSAVLLNLLGYVGWLTYQFTPIGVGLGVWGAWVLRTRSRHVCHLLAALFLTHAVFSSNYHVPDRFAFHQPSYIVFAWAIVVGVERFLGRLGRLAAAFGNGRVAAVTAAGVLAGAPLLLYPMTVPALRALGLDDARLGIPSVGSGVGERAEYFLNPNHRGDWSAARFGRQTLDALAPSALVLAPKAHDQEAYLVLRYFQLVEGMRPDVELDLLLTAPAAQVVETIARRTVAEAPCRPVYWVSLDAAAYPTPALRAEFTFVPEARLYRVRPVAASDGTLDCSRAAATASRRVAIEDIVRAAMTTR